MRQVLPFDWLTTDHLVSGESTLHQVTGYEFTDTLFSSIENFSASQPSLARLYSAATSPSERLRSDGSLAINCLKSYKYAENDGINMKPEKKNTKRNITTQAYRSRCSSESHQVIKTFRIVQRGEVSLLRVAYFLKR